MNSTLLVTILRIHWKLTTCLKMGGTGTEGKGTVTKWVHGLNPFRGLRETKRKLKRLPEKFCHVM